MLTFALAGAAAAAFASAPPVPLPPFGHGRLDDPAPGPGSHNCITWRDRIRIAAQVADYEARFGPLSSATDAAPPKYVCLPIAGTAYREIPPQGFVDLDPTAGFQDFLCEDRTYDGHLGIDTGIRSFAEQLIGVPCLAAADGVVVATHDGEFDMSVDWAWKPANYVVIDHGGGRIANYFHLRKDSVAVNVGDTLRAGQQIGLIGSSGVSKGPHVHLETADSGTVIEPYAGLCRPGESQWLEQPEVVRSLYAMDCAITQQDLWTTPGLPYEQPRTGQFALTDEHIFVWVDIANLPANSFYRFALTRPDGAVVTEWTYDFVEGGHPMYPASSWFWWTTAPLWDRTLGPWKAIVEINGAPFIEIPFQVRETRDDTINTPPKAVSLAFDPPAPASDDVLFARCDASLCFDDAEYDIVRYRWVWKRNGAPVRDRVTAGRADAFARSSFDPGDVIEVSVTPGDGKADGPTTTQRVTISGGVCRPDCNGDGRLNINDFICFQAEWRKKSAYGDYNGDGKWNINDFIAFQAGWRSGCG